jgi:16S rRNA (cytosine1402-N4)-methyltransferase
MSIKEHPPQDEASLADDSLVLHVPVLLADTLSQLAPKPGESYLDLTAGYGGHASKVLEVTQNFDGSVLVDRDENAVATLKPFEDKGTTILQLDFAGAATALVDEGRKFDMILVDLGVSSPQLDRAERGFSFTYDGPLDMRMDASKHPSAADIVNTSSEDDLYKIIREYGEENPRFARRVAGAIVRSRPFSTTKELADLVLAEHKGRWQRIHPATRTFQALRIATNDELGQLESLLPLLPQLLTPGGRVGVISFHSLEDRLVKRYFKEQSNAGFEAELEIPLKKPIDGATYDVHNPRARSAKLRVAVKK